MTDTILELSGISKHFPGIKALDGVNLNIRLGEVHALIGENGAGKSTLVKILTGVHDPTAGKILYMGQELLFKNALEAQAAGITAIHQEASMFSELSIAENIFMGHHLKSQGPLKNLDWRGMRKKTSALLKQLDLDLHPDTLIKNLGVAQRHMVEIAKALSIDARIVIMDEPTSALTMREVEDLYKIIRRLRDEGKAIIFISHKFDEIFEIADYFTVLRDGKYIGEGEISESSVDKIVTMMVGRSLDQMFPKSDAAIGEKILEVNNISQTGFFKDISFDLHKGEILGFFGLIGSGRTEVMRTVFGIETSQTGSVRMNGKPVKIRNPKDAINLGIAFVPEDRQAQGVILDMDLCKNITLPQLDSISPMGKIDRSRERSITEKYGTMMEIRSSGWNVNANTLSGGNQQKVVLAKWLATQPVVLILDEPTKGIDVGTKAAVHKFVSDLASKGLGVILVSSELPEVLGMSDRIIVMHEGRITREFTRDEADSEKIIRAATAVVAGAGGTDL
ncbi:sugar ABC transporter ATP-binding protein [Marispirochaeta sp.]|uniref:sugar ABC transporter ATP-binding protein n=1 Tax=Marispirochaeta sp. TaxID=2038653 RepID=UPI0029C85DF9|nr:sugar ABC transporter ATP-binding protein [Marispirochaeta sp.]